MFILSKPLHWSRVNLSWHNTFSMFRSIPCILLFKSDLCSHLFWALNLFQVCRFEIWIVFKGRREYFTNIFDLDFFLKKLKFLLRQAVD